MTLNGHVCIFISELVKDIMEDSKGLCGDTVELKVPLKVSLSTGQTWGHLSDYNPSLVEAS